MTRNRPQPITLRNAGETHALIGVSTSAFRGVWIDSCEDDMTTNVRLVPEDVRTLRDWLSEYLGDENDADQTGDDDGWEEVTDWENNPPRPGDELEWTHTNRDLVEIRRGILSHIEGGTQVRAREDGLLGYMPVGTWRVRRTPVPDPAEVVELPTGFGDVITDVKVAALTFPRMVFDGRRWCSEGAVRGSGAILAFTLPDGTRARRDGEHADGTPRFVKEDSQ